MNKCVLFFLCVCFLTCKGTKSETIKNNAIEEICGKWYRNTLFSTAELIINEDMTFSIKATTSANSGEVEGKIVKVNGGNYFSVINDQYDSEFSCIIIFENLIESINITVYGWQVGAGGGVYYDGVYEKQPLSQNEYIEQALDYIIGNYYDKNKLKNLLGEDIDYFIGCFGTVFRKEINNGVLLEGFMRGVAPWQNGIIKIENNKIYILITDCREELLFRYYTDNAARNNIPDEFRQWSYFNEKFNIKKGRE